MKTAYIKFNNVYTLLDLYLFLSPKICLYCKLYYKILYASIAFHVSPQIASFRRRWSTREHFLLVSSAFPSSPPRATSYKELRRVAYTTRGEDFQCSRVTHRGIHLRELSYMTQHTDCHAFVELVSIILFVASRGERRFSRQRSSFHRSLD